MNSGEKCIMDPLCLVLYSENHNYPAGKTFRKLSQNVENFVLRNLFTSIKTLCWPDKIKFKL